MTRRDFIRFEAAMFCMLATACLARIPAWGGTDRPNFLFIICDEAMADGTGTREALRVMQEQHPDKTGKPLMLYDLENDPNEWTNLADNPEYDETRNRLNGILDSLNAPMPSRKQPKKKAP